MTGPPRLSGSAVLSLALGLAGVGVFAAGGAPGGGVLFSSAYRDTVITGDTFPRTLTDPLGVTQVLPRPPVRRFTPPPPWSIARNARASSPPITRR